MLSVQNYSNSNCSYSPNFKAIKPRIKPNAYNNNIKKVVKPITLTGTLALIATKMANFFKAEEDNSAKLIDKEYHKFLDSFEKNPYEDFNADDTEAFNNCARRFY